MRTRPADSRQRAGYPRVMDVTEQLRAWGAAHAQARRAEHAARQDGNAESAAALRRQAKSLRERADRLHREVYLSLGRPGRETTR